jgi:hypothetical protein
MSVDVGLVKKLSSVAGGRIYLPGNVPQEPQLPYVRVRNISTTDPARSQDGGSGLRVERFQFKCIDSTYNGALTVAKAVRAALMDFRGTSDGTTFQGIADGGGRTDYEEETKRHVRDVDLMVTFKEG